MSWADVWSVTRSNRTPRRGAPGDNPAAVAGQLGEPLAGVAEQADRQADALVGGLADAVDGIVDVGGHLVQVAGLEPAGDGVRVALDVEACGTGERRGQRLGAAHAAQAGVQDGAAGQVGRAPVTLAG